MNLLEFIINKNEKKYGHINVWSNFKILILISKSQGFIEFGKRRQNK